MTEEQPQATTDLVVDFLRRRVEMRSLLLRPTPGQV
jgi:hypothetical protein